jgi:hypothetical protein
MYNFVILCIVAGKWYVLSSPTSVRYIDADLLRAGIAFDTENVHLVIDASYELTMKCCASVLIVANDEQGKTLICFTIQPQEMIG